MTDGTPRVRFIGDPNDNYSGPEVMFWQGVRFVKGQYADVTEQVEDQETVEKVIAKARTHTHFQVEGESEADIGPVTDEERLHAMSPDQLRAILASREVSHPANTGHARLVALVMSSGGLPQE